MKRIFAAGLSALVVFLLAVTHSQGQVSRWKLEGWQTDFDQLAVSPADILSGGPSIDHPEFVAASGHGELTDRDPVIGLEINGDARAYPLRILTWHEIVNDTVGGVAVAVTYCPLCNAAIVFDATVNGKVHTFGTTGKLRNSDLIM